MENSDLPLSLATTDAAAVLLAVYGNDSPVFFRQAIDSLLTQRNTSIPINIYLGIDGALPQGLEDVVRLYSKSILKISRSDKRQGLARTLNRLIAELGPETYVFRMDADDICMPNRFALQIDFLAKNADVDIVGGGMVEFLENGMTLPPRFYPRAHEVRRIIARVSPLAHPTVCFRRTALDRLKAYPTNGTNEDIALWFKAISMGMKIDNIDEILLKFRLTDGTIARRGFSKAFSEYRAYASGLISIGRPLAPFGYPLARLIFRLAPRSLVRALYHTSAIRTRLSGRSQLTK